jgi:hypothetical protein
MSYQVGFVCYSSVQDAGEAACRLFEPVTAVSPDGSQITTVSCKSSDFNGALVLQKTINKNGLITVSDNTMSMVHQPCMYTDFVDAGLAIFAALLGVWAVTLGYRKIIELLNWSRGES